MLRFLRRQIGYRIKKRTFVVLALSVLTTVLTATILSLAAVWLVGPADITRVSILEPDRRVQILGTGVNLDQAVSDNILIDASFEPVASRKMLTVYAGDAQSLTVADSTLDPSILADGFYVGASARVLSSGQDGLTLKKTATVASYNSNRVGQFQMVQLPADLPSGREILGFADNGDVSIAVGKSGLILRDLAQAQPVVVDAGMQGDLTDVTTVNFGFLICSSNGELLFSPDALSWQALPKVTSVSLRAIAANENGLVVAVGDEGLILAGSAESVSPTASPIQSNLVDLVYGNGVFLALAEDGTVLRSTNGTLWRIIELEQSLKLQWSSLAFADGIFALADDGGQVAVSEDGLQFQKTLSKLDIEIKDILLLSKKQMIVLGQDNLFRYSSDGGESWKESNIDTGFVSQRLDTLGNRQIVSADDSGQIGIAPLVIEITLDQPLVSGTFATGDLLFLEKTSQTIEAPDSWEVFGAQEASRTMLSVPDESGLASMHLTAPVTSGDHDPVILSQSINPDQFSSRNGSDIYTIELWMRQEQIADSSVRIWLSGDFQSIGTTIDHVGSTWKKYTHAFVVPKNLVDQAKSMRFNISFSGGGELWLDKVFFGQLDQTPRGLNSNLCKEIQSVSPPTLRLSFLSLGSNSLPSFQWAKLPGNEAPVFQEGEWSYIGGQSLASAMELARDGQSSPWLVVQSGMGETELLDLLEYLSGPITSPYGHLRMSQGEILPWIESFDQVYLEFSDPDQQLPSDSLRSSWIDWMIEVIRQSPYYNDLKNKLVFVDGISYSDGVWRSSADYHSSQLIGLYQGTNQNGIQPALAAYFDQLPRNPAQSRQGWHEIIAVASLHGFEGLQPTLADLVSLQLEELGKSAGLVNLDLRASTDKDYRIQDAVAAQITDLTQNSQLLETTCKNDDLHAFAFEITGTNPTTRRIFLANQATTPLSIRINGSTDIKGMRSSSYDKDGLLLRQRTINSSQDTLAILPGGVIILEG